MTLERTLKKIRELDENKYFQNQIAQLNARYILFNTSESEDNFPNYNVKEKKLVLLAFQYLTLGCRLAESDFILESTNALEKGAQILEYIYGSANNKIENRGYHGLISSLAYYSAFQYSKSFILIRKIEGNTTIANLLSLFLKRRFSLLENAINIILVNEEYLTLRGNSEEDEASDRIYEIVIARALGKLLSYFRFGDLGLLEETKRELKTLKEIADLRNNADIWWVIRLLLIIIFGVEKSSLWNVLGSHYDTLPDLAKRFIYSHVFSQHTKIHEFFTTQRQALDKVIGQDTGVVISMPTSSGKTRIAEVAILDCKIQYEDAKILFIAPYRSLAFEIEGELEKVFTPIGISVSQLYGGGLFNRLDEKLIQETDVIIATQEKAKALFRSDSAILKQIKLIVLDEGHLLGGSDRYTRNELFIEELRFHMMRNSGKFIVLSAVLPNSSDLSMWLTNSADNVYKSDWRPSEERLGILEWTGKNVNLNWESADDERDSFNKRFIVAEKLPRIKYQKKDKYLPNDKNEAVASTALKLYSFGPVLIFVGLKVSVFTMAKSYLRVLGSVEDFTWKNQNNWNSFELACEEYDGNNSLWIKYARKGILCHNANLPSDVRVPLERLMRTERPRVIIATSTLGQGVNLGVSSVIFSTVYQAGNLITHGDFWNIAGRAGRAFIDQEGKILVAQEVMPLVSKRTHEYNQGLIKSYFNKSQIQEAESGLLILIRHLKHLALRFNDLDFNTFLLLIAENKLTDLEFEEDYITRLDLIDDTLLALHQLANTTDDVNNVSWVEKFFNLSLAFIQQKHDPDVPLSRDVVIPFIQSRIKGVVSAIGEDRTQWDAHIKSGIPLQSDLLLETKLHDIIQEIDEYIKYSDETLENKIDLLWKIESLINNIPVLKADYLNTDSLQTIRIQWMTGQSMTVINENENSHDIVREHFAFKLPWVLNGLSNKLSNLDKEHQAEILQEISILVETGLPNLVAVKIYQAGIRSREASTEMSEIFHEDSWELGINYYKNKIYEKRDLYKILFSATTGKWIDLMLSYSSINTKTINNIDPFPIDLDIPIGIILLPKTINKEEYLVSVDLKYTYPINVIEGVYFGEVMDQEGVFFYLNLQNDLWTLEVVNPRIQLSIKK